MILENLFTGNAGGHNNAALLTNALLRLLDQLVLSPKFSFKRGLCIFKIGFDKGCRIYLRPGGNHKVINITDYI